MDVYDPWASPHEAHEEYGVDLIGELRQGYYDAVIIAVSHQEFVAMGIDKIRALGKAESVVFDVKYLFPKDAVDESL